MLIAVLFFIWLLWWQQVLLYGYVGQCEGCFCPRGGVHVLFGLFVPRLKHYFTYVIFSPTPLMRLFMGSPLSVICPQPAPIPHHHVGFRIHYCTHIISRFFSLSLFEGSFRPPKGKPYLSNIISISQSTVTTVNSHILGLNNNLNFRALGQPQTKNAFANWKHFCSHEWNIL